jgi:uncharacterized protein
MGRFLVLVLIVVAVVWLVKRALRSGEAEVAQKPPVQGELVPCARCGVNLPRAEAREAGGALYCSDEHARLGKA